MPSFIDTSKNAYEPGQRRFAKYIARSPWRSSEAASVPSVGAIAIPMLGVMTTVLLESSIGFCIAAIRRSATDLRVVGTRDIRQDDHEFVAAQATDVAGPLDVRRIGSAIIDAAQRLAQPLGGDLQHLVADCMTQRVVDALEIVEVDIHDGQHLALLQRRFERRAQAGVRLLPVGQPGQRIEVGEARQVPLRAPLARERDGHLPHFMRMKRLLQVRELVFGRHPAPDVAGIHVGVGRAHRDLDGGVDLTDVGRGPDAVRAGRHAHVEEGHCERLLFGERLLDCGNRGFRAIAVDGIKRQGGRRQTGRLTGRFAAKELGAKLLARSALRAMLRLAEDLTIGVADRSLVVNDEDADRRTCLFCHG